MKIIFLNQNKIALVDDEDYEYLNQWKWSAYLDHNKWYAIRTIKLENNKQKQIKMHRLIMQAKENQEIDHEDGDGLNNQKYNLRIATHQQNLFNRGKNKNNTSGFKGVRLDKRVKLRPWQAIIKINYKWKHLGMYETAEEAAMAYDQAAKELHGEFANLNF